MASAAAHALTSGSLSSSLTRPHATSDSRLLTNLVKCEKALSSHLDEEVKAAHTASAALAAWGTSEAPDIAATANRLSNLLNAVADVQRTHVQAIEGYRSALKDVLDREQSIRTVVRDRDILVGRLIKASKKTKGTDAERAEKVNRAQVSRTEDELDWLVVEGSGNRPWLHTSTFFYCDLSRSGPNCYYYAPKPYTDSLNPLPTLLLFSFQTRSSTFSFLLCLPKTPLSHSSILSA